jgi:hypothetical protein
LHRLISLGLIYANLARSSVTAMTMRNVNCEAVDGSRGKMIPQLAADKTAKAKSEKSNIIEIGNESM